MRKLASTTVLLAVAIGLTACGGSDNAAFVGTGTTTGTTTGTGTGTGTTTTTISLGNGSGSAFKSGVLEISPSTQIGAGGSATITATIANQSGTLDAGTPVTIVFNSKCVGLGTATILGPVGSTLPAGSVSTITGTATATYTAKGCSGSDPITATATVTGTNGTTSNLSATGSVSIAQATVGSIQFVSATPSTIGLKGTGLNETSTVIFKVVDSSGGPRSGALVTFALNTTVGGLALSQSSATSGADGTVQTIVSSGTVHTTVVVSASISSPALSTNSSVLAVSTGLPASDGFSIATGTGSSGNACPNVEAYNIDGVTIPIVVRLADRYNNPAPDGTAVAFTTDGGHIVGNCTTPGATPGDGTCSATWTSANPRPVPGDDHPPIKAAGRTTVLATAIGEESFTDINGNGYYDVGEPFKDLGEPYRDDNENGAYDLGEYFLDFNHNGVRDAPDGTFKGITCNGSTPTSTCSTTTLAIGATLQIIMSTSGAVVTLVPPAATLTFKAGTNPGITFNVKDQNGNIPAAGSTVTVAASSNVGSFTEATFTIACSTALGGVNFTSFLAASTTAPASGNISITVVSPSGDTSVSNIPTTITP
jgi:hypothetical protein